MSLLEGVGHVTWWGHTPSVDLASSCTHNKTDKLTILTVGASDLRHILDTMCSGRDVELYVIETNLEQYCRDIMLLSVLLQPSQTMGLQEKTELYLDLYGNSLIRSHSMKFVRNNVPSYIRMVTDEDYLRETLPMLDMSLLKYKERDFMESIFKFWSGDSPYEIAMLWDNRVRKYLGIRYDAGRNAFDLDFNMKLKERATLLDFHEYAFWRQTGVSYDVRDGIFDSPNRTLCSGIIAMREGAKQLLRGYWGDIVISPFISHGVYSTLKSMYEVRNRVNVRTSREVAEYNIMSLIYRINTGTKYTAPPKPDRFTFTAKSTGKEATIAELDEDEKEEVEEKENSGEVENVKNKGSPKMELSRPHSKLKIKFLPLGTVEQLSKKQSLLRAFDMIYFGSSQVHYFTPEITQLLKDDANVLVENIKYIAPLTRDQESQYLPKIKTFGVDAKCELLGSNDKMNNNFHFSYHRTD